MSAEEKQYLKRFLKWFVPKISGATVLILAGIQAKGQLPRTREDFILIAVGVGLAFASNSRDKN
jgi:hypothetical protein